MLRLTFGHFLDDNYFRLCFVLCIYEKCQWSRKCFSQNSLWTMKEMWRKPNVLSLKWPLILWFPLSKWLIYNNMLLLCIHAKSFPWWKFYNAHRVRVIFSLSELLSESHFCPPPHSFSLLFKLHVYFFVHHFVALSYRATKETECQIPIYQLNMLLHKLLTELSQLDHIFMDQTMHCGSSWTWTAMDSISAPKLSDYAEVDKKVAINTSSH